MKLALTLTPPVATLPYSYQSALTGCLHKWFGEDNPYHEGVSLYGGSFLKGGTRAARGLAFPRGATWTLGFLEHAMTRDILEGILLEPEVAFGMKVDGVRLLPEPDFGTAAWFRVNGCILLRRKRPDGSQEHLLYDHPEADEALTRSLQYKLRHAGYEGRHLEAQARFNRRYERARSRKFTVHGIEYRGSECPVHIAGTPEALAFAWTVGIGQLTGCCFGALE